MLENPFQQRQESYEQAFQSSGHAQVQEGFPKKAAVLFDFEAEMEGELTVSIGTFLAIKLFHFNVLCR